MQMSYGIAEYCKTCNTKILHHESISVCDCYRYCHQKCMILEMSAKNKNKDQLMYVCMQCNRTLGLDYKMEIQCKPHLNRINIVLILASIILIPIAVYAMLINQKNFLTLTTLSFSVFMLLCLLTLAIINSFLVREFLLEGIRSTHLGLIISAFVQL